MPVHYFIRYRICLLGYGKNISGVLGLLIVGSMSIVVNFLTGPAMLELPGLYQKSGIIPTTLTILIVAILSTLGSLHLARVISQIPGNSNFEHPYEYSDVFYHYFRNHHHRHQSSSSTKSTTMTMTTSDPNNNDNDNNHCQHHRTDNRLAKFLVWVTKIAFFACITSLNISSMVDSAQVMDSILANPHLIGQTVGLGIQIPPPIPTQQVSKQSQQRQSTQPSITTTIRKQPQVPTLPPLPPPPRHYFQLIFWNYNSCRQQEDIEGECIPFAFYNADLQHDDNPISEDLADGDGCILTLGYLLTVICFLPLSLMDLQENASWQVVEFFVLLLTSVMFAFLFWNIGFDTNNISWWGASWDGLLGVILFNFALVISISSWLHEKEPSVNVRQVIIGSTTLAAFLYITLGILGAMAIPQVSSNMLQSFLSGTFGPAMQFTASIFALFIVGLGIPLLCVLCRLNLQGGSSNAGGAGGIGNFTEGTANYLAVYLPFGISWMLYRGESVTELLSWGGTICTSLIAFVFPWIVALKALNTLDIKSVYMSGTTSTTTTTTIIDVYGKCWKSKFQHMILLQNGLGKEEMYRRIIDTERTLLWILLCLSLICIASAIVGNLFE